jgi:maltose alpha-D-glucosyltransferase/alpha-amylase
MQPSQFWYKNAIFYQVNVRAFYDSSADGHGDFEGVTKKLDYLKDLGVDCLWLMPFYNSPLNDDGYDISDFFRVLPAFGTIEQLKTLVESAHHKGLRVITDMIMNHTSDQHPWFQSARTSPQSPFRDYYVWSDTVHKFEDARIIFVDTEESNWTWDEQAGQYYWHRFYASQPDLNYRNPEVQKAMLNVMKYWLEIGIDGFRADAVPYLFEREGTNCENLPETHAFLKEIRSFIDTNYPGCILLAEANQWPKEVLPYFGDGDEFQMGFHFPLMPRIFLSLKKADRTSLVWILNETPPIPDNCQWCTFLRNHDELTLEMVTEEERQYLWQQYAPDPKMRMNLGIRRRLAPLLDNDLRKIRLANALLYGLPGSPIIYYGDEIGMGDNIDLFDRNGVRTPMQWTPGQNAGFSSAPAEQLYEPVITQPPFDPASVNVQDQLANPESLFNFMKQLVRVRKENPVLAEGSLQWLNPPEKAVLACLRSKEGVTVLVLNNLSDQPQQVYIQRDDLTGTPLDLWTNQPMSHYKDGIIDLTLQPYQFVWLSYEEK